jgi:hypothetical protein
MAFKYKTAKGSSQLADTPFYTGKIVNERILSKRETYAHLVDEVGGKKGDHAAAWKGIAKAIALNAEQGNAARVEGLGTFRNVCKGGFDGSTGPWVKGRNYIQVACVELNEFKNALKDVTPVNDTTGDKPMIKSVLNVTLDDYDIVRAGDTLSIGGVNLAPDTEKADEFVALYRDGILVAKATIVTSELNTVTCKFEGVTLEPGECKLVVFTRCGEAGEDVSVKSDSRIVTVAAAA